eukprot:TRINITY_DN31066_c0_g1_i1.p1 TRINITY_DN31066_c0_g1~~TRINITY_DN31066_c0_g1_i1.p1  ORF type:complete len:209 (+),score=27.52 TRINITY_DN31066_c0_g1_i1:61-687(+)
MPPMLRRYEQNKDYADALKVLRSAFKEDPLFMKLYGKRLDKGLNVLLEGELEYRGEETYVLVDGEEILGVVILGEKPDSFCKEDWATMKKEKKLLGFCSVMKTLFAVVTSLMWVLDNVQKWKKGKTHIRVVGISSAHHGKGYGTIMMAQMLGYLDAQHKGHCYLESSNPKNIKFYERQGFEVKGADSFRGCPITAMVRCNRCVAGYGR